MCDYSLMCFPNRLAYSGEDLVVHRFSSGSNGLASPAELTRNSCPESAPNRSFWARVRGFLELEPERPVTAVCIPPCSRLALHNLSERLQADLGVQAEEEVVFEELDAEPNRHRDAVRFRNGRVLRLQDLPAELCLTVLDLGSPQPRPGDLSELRTLETAGIRGR